MPCYRAQSCKTLRPRPGLGSHPLLEVLVLLARLFPGAGRRASAASRSYWGSFMALPEAPRRAELEAVRALLAVRSALTSARAVRGGAAADGTRAPAEGSPRGAVRSCERSRQPFIYMLGMFPSARRCRSYLRSRRFVLTRCPDSR